MNKIYNYSVKTIMLILYCILFWVVINGLFNYDKVSYAFNPILLCIGIAMYIIGITVFDINNNNIWFFDFFKYMGNMFKIFVNCIANFTYNSSKWYRMFVR